MLFIEGPSLLAPVEEWEQYLIRLNTFNPHDKTVRFEKERAKRIIKVINDENQKDRTE